VVLSLSLHPRRSPARVTSTKLPAFSDQITPNPTDCVAPLVKLECAAETSNGPCGACNSEKKESSAADARQRAQHRRFARRTVHAPSFCDFLPVSTHRLIRTAQTRLRFGAGQGMSSPSHGDGPAAEHLTVSTGSPHKTRSLADFLRRRKDAKSAKSEAVAVSPAAAKEAGQKDLQESPRSSAPGSPEESPSILSAVAPRVKKSSKFGSRKSSHHPAAAAVAAGPSARVAREELVLAPKPDAAATLEVTVVEARGVAAGLCFFRITVEGSTGSTASLEGPDAVFHVTEVSGGCFLFSSLFVLTKVIRREIRITTTLRCR
jgi:hypothetical protein